LSQQNTYPDLYKMIYFFRHDFLDRIYRMDRIFFGQDLQDGQDFFGQDLQDFREIGAELSFYDNGWAKIDKQAELLLGAVEVVDQLHLMFG